MVLSGVGASNAGQAGNTTGEPAGSFFLAFGEDERQLSPRGKTPEGRDKRPSSFSVDGASRPFTRQQTWMGDRPQSPMQSTPATQFLQRFGYLVDDLVGEGDKADASRVRLPITGLYLANFLQRCATAIVFGVFHFSYVSLVQVGLLLALHLSFIVYLVTIRPYWSWLLLASDVTAYLCEVMILVCGVLLLQHPHNPHLAQALLMCYYLDIMVVMLPDLLQLLTAAAKWAWVNLGSTSAPASDAVAGQPEVKRGKSQAAMQQEASVGQERQPDGAAAAAAAAALRLTADGRQHQA